MQPRRRPLLYRWERWAHRAAADPKQSYASLEFLVCVWGEGGEGPHSEASTKGPRAPCGRGAVFWCAEPAPGCGLFLTCLLLLESQFHCFNCDFISGRIAGQGRMQP